MTAQVPTSVGTAVGNEDGAAEAGATESQQEQEQQQQQQQQEQQEQQWQQPAESEAAALPKTKKRKASEVEDVPDEVKAAAPEPAFVGRPIPVD